MSLVLNVSVQEFVRLRNLTRYCMSFVFSAVIADEPDCRLDRDCPLKLTCTRETCQNPCIVSNPCTNSQTCVVSTAPAEIRSVSCICPEGEVTNAQGQCIQVQASPECSVDNDCPFTDKCHQGSCTNACVFAKCGSFAVCQAQAHEGICYCIEGYSGNPQSACYPSKIPLLNME
jgi:hypothetical protein